MIRKDLVRLTCSFCVLIRVMAIKASFVWIVPYVMHGETLIVIIVTAVQYLISASPRYCLCLLGNMMGWPPFVHGFQECIKLYIFLSC